jgi:hypothetical protein
MFRRHPTRVSLAGGALVAIALAIALAGHGHQFVTALGSAPLWVLGAAVALHVVWLIARSEAWSICIGAAGGSVSRRRLYHASSIGYLGNIFNGQFGLGVRIALAVLRGMRGRSSIIALVCVAVVLQIARNWLLLNWSGVDASVLDATALLIGLAVVGLFPVGPSLGAATAVLVLGTNGAAASAAAGTLLTATAAAGALCFASWALADRLWPRATTAEAPAST